ncbi:MAG: DUF3256 family protein [Prevotella sp.]|nr:DUF3256 family protein [Prevotella sp.]
MNKRIVISALLAILTILPLSATTIKELWIAAPDSLFPYLDKAKRLELVDVRETKNKLDGISKLDTLTSGFMQVSLNKLTQVQMKLVPVDGDTLICMVKTYMLPESDSEVVFYDTNWRLKRRVALDWRNYVAKADTMSNETFKRKLESLKLAFVKATINADNNLMDLEVEAPLQPKEEKTDLSAILQINVKVELENVK